jgi:hypothetical protein
MNNLKEEYTTLRVAYTKLVSQRLKNTAHSEFHEKFLKAKREAERLSRENEGLRGKVGFLESEV